MVDSSNQSSDMHRVIFPSSQQRRFIEDALISTNLSINEASVLLKIHARTLRDWRREKFSMSLGSVRKLCQLTNQDLPKDIVIQEPYWYAVKGAKLGIAAATKKYGKNPLLLYPDYRMQKWKEWWDSSGQYMEHKIISKRKEIIKPGFSIDTAEFVGLMIGDGGMSTHQLSVTLNGVDDGDYVVYVGELLKSLFGLKVLLVVKKYTKAVDLRVSSKNLIEYCHDVLGLCVGNKLTQNLNIPYWINTDQSFQVACLRGIFDTDGCVFYEIHRMNGKRYSYPRINFTSLSPLLISSIYDILQSFGFSPVIRRSGKAVQLESKVEIERYFALIGTSNPKHLRRFAVR